MATRASAAAAASLSLDDTVNLAHQGVDSAMASSVVDVDALRSNGWALGDLRSPTESALRNDLVSLASVLGNPIAARRGGPIISALRPTNSEYARRRSLSAKFSVGAFPCHTDTADWVIPCRFVLLACLEPGAGDRKTILLDSTTIGLTTEQRESLHTTPFRVVSGRRSFFSTVMQHGRRFLRYDPGCMRPLAIDGERVLGLLASDSWPELLTAIRWARGRLLVIDNWRMLHGRSSADADDSQPTLLRIYIRGSVE
jgi:Taurine catabolism dioxygenase TauD, TfdA family